MEAVNTWRFGRPLRAAAVVLMAVPALVDIVLIGKSFSGSHAGIPVATFFLLAAVSVIFAFLMLRLVRAAIILDGNEIKFRNLSEWTSVSLRDISEFEITRNGLRIVKNDGSSLTAYALQRSLFSARSREAWILDNALQKSRELQ